MGDVEGIGGVGGTAGAVRAGVAMSRVLVVGKGPPDHGGIPTFIDTLLHSELAHEHDLTFLNVARQGTTEGGRASAGNLIRTVADALAVRRAARRHDVVHIQSALAPMVTVARASLLAWAARRAGTAVVVHAHGGNIGDWLQGPHGRWRPAFLRLAMRPADRVVAVWTAGERVLRSVLDPAKVTLVENGVPLDDFRPAGFKSSRLEHRVPRVLYAGLLTPRKGVLDLFAASRLLADRGVEHELHVVGGMPDEGPEAEQQVLDAAGGDHVRLLGRRPPEQMADAYAEADVFVLPSWWEAMPLTVLEAMASGLPVIATDVGDVARAVDHGVTGFVVPPRAPEQLADALEKLLRDEGQRNAMGAAGRDRVAQRFSSSATAAAVSAVYADVVRQRAR
jgi:glycosyltransferase involved in cell wall biosynthesis